MENNPPLSQNAENNTQQAAPQRKKNNIGLKLLVIAALSVTLLIPRYIIGNLIDKRAQTADEASYEVFEKWGYDQIIAGPVIFVPFKDGKTETIKKYTGEIWDVVEEDGSYQEEAYETETIKGIYITADEQTISSKITTEELHRGIYDMVVFKSSTTISGTFAIPSDFKDLDRYDFANSQIVASMGNSGGSPSMNLNIGGGTAKMSPGQDDNSNGYFSHPYNATALAAGQAEKFELRVEAKGSSSIGFVPIGKTTKLHVESNHASPSFNGRWLPDSRQINKNGFSADWEIQPVGIQHNDNPLLSGEEIVTVELKMPVDQYLQNTRAIKYSFLIVVLTFITVFFVEIRRRTHIHWIQYLLIGLAIMLFYTLLLSFSEHIAFGWSYLIASAMTIGLITAYMAAILKATKTALSIGILLALLYAFVYVLLSLETLSLLVGCIGVFVVLALAMYASIKIKWDEISVL